MTLDIGLWATKCLKDDAGLWNLEKWEELKTKFITTLILPRNTTFSVDTLEEVHRYTDTAMLCISFLESADLLGGKSLDGYEVLEEKKWLYKLIISEVRACAQMLNDKYEHPFPGLSKKTCTVLKLPYLYACNDLKIIETMGHLPPIKH